MTLNGDNWEASYDFTNGDYFTFATNDACVSSKAVLTLYNAETTAASDKCYVNDWILFRDPLDATKYIAGIYDPSGLIDRTQIAAKVDVNTAFADLGKGSATQASRLMRRMLQVDCNNCFDAIANPNPNFIVRMFYSPTEKNDAENVEANNIDAIKTSNGITNPHFFKWFKAANKTAVEVVTGLSPAGIAAGGQEWSDGALPTGQVDGVDYIDFTAVNSFSTFGGAWVVNIVNVLPVTWLSVEATPVDNNTIAIKWSTIAEINNAGFVVERSKDGQNYEAIAAVAGQTVNPGLPAYYFVNDNTVSGGVLYYYRIKQTDIDGRASYSKIVTARLDTENTRYVQVRPNPVSGNLKWHLYVSRPQLVQVSIHDVAGRTLNKKKLSAQAGDNNYTMEMTEIKGGTYLLRIVYDDGSVMVEKFMIP